jgi:drug/metabolite transporter (DMT)-like permease
VAWTVFMAALCSAFFHACWNMFAKLGSAPRDLLLGIVVATASLCALALPVVGLPPAKAWPWLGAGALCNVIYTRVLIRLYARANFGFAYTIVKAVIPPILFLVGWAFLGEASRISAIIGLAAVFCSVVVFAVWRRESRFEDWRGVCFAATAGGVLAIKLLLDVDGIRTCGDDWNVLIPYAVSSSVATAVGLIASTTLTGVNPFKVLIHHTGLCYTGALFLLVSWLSGMWAYAQGPIGLVAPICESAIVFGAILAVLVLREPLSKVQCIAVGLATFGVALIQTQ